MLVSCRITVLSLYNMKRQSASLCHWRSSPSMLKSNLSTYMLQFKCWCQFLWRQHFSYLYWSYVHWILCTDFSLMQHCYVTFPLQFNDCQNLFSHSISDTNFVYRYDKWHYYTCVAQLNSEKQSHGLSQSASLPSTCSSSQPFCLLPSTSGEWKCCKVGVTN